MATVLLGGRKQCFMKPEPNRLDSDRPSHGKRYHSLTPNPARQELIWRFIKQLVPNLDHLGMKLTLWSRRLATAGRQPNWNLSGQASTTIFMPPRSNISASVIVGNDYRAGLGSDIASVVFCLDSNRVTAPVQITP
jgi:hypothetical protein